MKAQLSRREMVVGVSALAVAGCTPPSRGAAKGRYRWTRLTAAGPFPPSYNFPVHRVADGRFVALHSAGTWSSDDGATWTAEKLPASGTNTGYLAIAQHDGAAWALGAIAGDYQRYAVDPVIRRTGDYRRWQTVGRSASLPSTIFYAVASWRGALWMLGGWRDGRDRNEVWRSTDGLTWARSDGAIPWSPRSHAKAAVFGGKLWIIGGGALDGAAAGDAWSTADGVDWRRDTARLADPPPVNFTPQVFDERLWLVGANRTGGFASEMLVTADGRDWTAERAPWSPRGGVATWTDGRRLYLTGGKYSEERSGETRFIYSNDVWAMERA